MEDRFEALHECVAENQRNICGIVVMRDGELRVKFLSMGAVLDPEKGHTYMAKEK